MTAVIKGDHPSTRTGSDDDGGTIVMMCLDAARTVLQEPAPCFAAASSLWLGEAFLPPTERGSVSGSAVEIV